MAVDRPVVTCVEDTLLIVACPKKAVKVDSRNTL